MERSLKEMRDTVLENKIVKIVPIVRRKGYLKPGHDGEHTYTGCYKTHGLPYDSKKRSYVNPFLKNKDNIDEQEIFEKLLNQKEGSLNLFDYKLNTPNFWGNFTIRIPKEGMELNLMNPADALMYRVILVNPKFAKNKDDAQVAECEYMVVNDEETKQQENSLAIKRDKANDFMHKIKKSKKEMVNILRLLGKKASVDMEADFLKGELYKIIEEVTNPRGLAGIDKFIEAVEDPIADAKIFVYDAIDSGDVVKDKMGYRLADNNKFVGRNFTEVIDYFNSKEPEIQEQKLIIKERLKV